MNHLSRVKCSVLFAAALSVCAVSVSVVSPTAVFADGMGEMDSGSAIHRSSGHRSSGEQDSARGSLADTSKVSSSAGTRFERASPADQSIATGHFARTRSMLIAALNEFDQGVKRADPSALMDVGAFRDGIRARIKELERVLEPQARESESGIKFSGDNRLLRTK